VKTLRLVAKTEQYALGRSGQECGDGADNVVEAERAAICKIVGLDAAHHRQQ